MIGGLDSSFDAPTLEQAKQAHAAGVRVWGGYFGSRDGLGLAVRWNRMSFWNLQQAGITPIGFCSGWDDEDWIRNTAAEWGILACVDVERGIRDDGPWVQGFLQRAQCGLYGPMSCHYETGEPPGRGANFNILAWYPGYDPRSTWFDAIEERPPGPCGWQWQGTHTEFGLSVDRSWFDELIIASGPGRGGDDDVTPEQFDAMLRDSPLFREWLAATFRVWTRQMYRKDPGPAPEPWNWNNWFQAAHAVDPKVGPEDAVIEFIVGAKNEFGGDNDMPVHPDQVQEATGAVSDDHIAEIARKAVEDALANG